MTRYRTIVADPPWHYDRVPTSRASRRDHNVEPGELLNEPLRYASLTADEIKALPVETLSDDDCRLFLWTTNRYLPLAFDVLTGWGFDYRQALVWHKWEGHPFAASVAVNTAEFVLVGAKGAPKRLSTLPSTVLKIPAPHQHSVKPDAFLDLVEQVSPGPYAELFARRARFGWDYPIGDQALGGVAA